MRGPGSAQHPPEGPEVLRVLFTGTPRERQVHRGHVHIVFWFQPEDFDAHLGKIRGRSVMGLWPSAKVCDMLDDSVTLEESRAPGGCTCCCRCAG